MWGPLHSQAGVPLREEERPTVLLVITIVLLVITINVGDDIYPFSVARSACGFVGRRLKDQAGLPTCSSNRVIGTCSSLFLQAVK